MLLGFGLGWEWGSWILHSVFGDADLDVNYGSVEELGAALIFASQEPQPPLDPAKHTGTIGETTSRASRLPSLTDSRVGLPCYYGGGDLGPGDIHFK